MTAPSDTDASRGPPGTTQGLWLFDDWRLLEADQRLEHAQGESQILDRSAYGVLRYLLLQQGEVCTPDELLAAGWPGRIVSTNSLAKCVSRLRKNLRDPDARLIRLVHGYGYRLVAEVRFLTAAPSEFSAPSGDDLAPGAAVPGRPHWRLVARLGRGGCGEVFAAESTEGQSDRAYKFTRSEEGLRALKREVALHRLLLQQGHGYPVLGLIDWNLETPPFFVATPRMPGGNLAEWAQLEPQASGTPATRLEWCVRLCEAVEALHLAGIAHRDLKPENIYPADSAQGVVNFLLGDLGAGAGMLPPGIDSLGLPIGLATRSGESAESDPASPRHRYLAPEVLAGHAPGTRSDIFSLGVICAQMLTGNFRLSLVPGWEESLGDTLLCSDLAEAAHMDPRRRLGSARELAERFRSLEARREASRREADIAHQAEQARTRERRLRARWRISATVTFFTTLALSISIWLGMEARAAKREALLHASQTASVTRFLTEELLSQADPYGHAEGGKVLLVEAMGKAAARIEARLAEDPGSAAAVHLAAAEAFEGWADHSRALHHAHEALRHLAAAEKPAADRTAAALRQLCGLARRAGQLRMAERACGDALTIERDRTGSESPGTMVESAKNDYEMGRCGSAIKRLDLLLSQTLGDEQPDWLGDALWFRGLCHGQLANFPAARRDFERLVALHADPALNPLATAWAHADFAEVLVIEGDFDRALAHLRVSEGLFAQKLGPEHVHSQMGDYQRARIALWSGRPGEAIPLYLKALGVWEERFGPDHAWSLYTRTELIWALAAAGRAEEARLLLSSERRRALAALGERTLQRSFFAEAWARTALLLDDADTAELEIERMREDSAAALPGSHPRHALVRCLRTWPRRPARR